MGLREEVEPLSTKSLRSLRSIIRGIILMILKIRIGRGRRIRRGRKRIGILGGTILGPLPLLRSIRDIGMPLQMIGKKRTVKTNLKVCKDLQIDWIESIVGLQLLLQLLLNIIREMVVNLERENIVDRLRKTKGPGLERNLIAKRENLGIKKKRRRMEGIRIEIEMESIEINIVAKKEVVHLLLL